MSVDVAIDVRAKLGEGPRWDGAAGHLLWVDIHGRALYVNDRAIPLDNRPGAAAPMTDGRVLVALADRLVALELEDESVETLVTLPHGADLRMNDGACDPAGRFWVGSTELDHAPGRGTLYRYDGALQPIVAEVSISNGLGWSPDTRLMYFTDTPTHTIDVFDFDLATGTPTGRRPFVTIEDGAGWPDGLSVDDEGCVWVALWGGHAVRRYLPDGRLDRVVELPAEDVTACCFGGNDGRSLFITTSTPDGRVYVTDVGVGGPPAQPFHASAERSTAPSDAEPTSAR